MDRTRRRLAWGAVFAVLVVLAVPWFLWGNARVVAGLPVWLWWHVGWMGLAAAVFYAFTRNGWEEVMGLDPDDGEIVAADRHAERETSRADREREGDRP